MLNKKLGENGLGLAAFSNKDLYWIIASIVSLPSREGKEIEEEFLYVQPFQNRGSYIKFIYLLQWRIDNEEIDMHEVKLAVGEIDFMFSSIKIKKVDIDADEFEIEYGIDGLKMTDLFAEKYNSNLIPNPVVLTDILNSITNREDFGKNENHLFKQNFTFNTQYAQEINFLDIDNEVYSGMYYKICDTYHIGDNDGVVIYHYPDVNTFKNEDGIEEIPNRPDEYLTIELTSLKEIMSIH